MDLGEIMEKINYMYEWVMGTKLNWDGLGRNNGETERRLVGNK